jgi:hypothetical protein
LLVAGAAFPGALENQALPIMTEVGFRILTAVGELLDVAEVVLAWLSLQRDRKLDPLGGQGSSGEKPGGKNFKISKHFLYKRLTPGFSAQRMMSAEDSTI